MYSSLITKARNVVVEIHLGPCCKKIAGKINEVDEVFAEVLVWIDEKTGEFAVDRKAFQKAAEGEAGWREDRILINIKDISIIA